MDSERATSRHRSIGCKQKKGRGPRRALSPPTTLHTRRSRILLHHQLVLHAEGARDLPRSQSRDGFIHGAIHRAVKRYVAVHHYNANRPRRIQCILAQNRIAVESPGRAQAQPIVKRRDWLDRDVRNHILHSRHGVDVSERLVAAYAGSILPFHRDYSILHAQREIIECAVVSFSNVSNLSSQFLLELLIGNIRPRHRDKVAHALRARSFSSELSRIQFALVEIDRTRQGDDAVLDAGFHVTELTLLRQLLHHRSLNLIVVAGSRRGLGDERRAQQPHCQQRTRRFQQTSSIHKATSDPN